MSLSPASWASPALRAAESPPRNGSGQVATRSTWNILGLHCWLVLALLTGLVSLTPFGPLQAIAVIGWVFTLSPACSTRHWPTFPGQLSVCEQRKVVTWVKVKQSCIKQTFVLFPSHTAEPFLVQMEGQIWGHISYAYPDGQPTLEFFLILSMHFNIRNSQSLHLLSFRW
jgi:hypothetical protein